MCMCVCVEKILYLFFTTVNFGIHRRLWKTFIDNNFSEILISLI